MLDSRVAHNIVRENLPLFAKEPEVVIARAFNITFGGSTRSAAVVASRRVICAATSSAAFCLRLRPGVTVPG
jgi:hypothetical protein